MTETITTTVGHPGPALYLPTQAQPVHRDDGSEQASEPSTGVEAAACGNLTGMARDLCYAQVYGITY